MPRKPFRYADKTKVPVERSRASIERVLSNYGATSFIYGWNRRKDGTEEVVISFILSERKVQLIVPMPGSEAEKRQRWRAALIVIKAKLEAVQSGIGTLETEFLANIVMRNGRTIGDTIMGSMNEFIETGRLLGPGKEGAVP
jgi:hypothetical protein